MCKLRWSLVCPDGGAEILQRDCQNVGSLACYGRCMTPQADRWYIDFQWFGSARHKNPFSLIMIVGPGPQC